MVLFFALACAPEPADPLCPAYAGLATEGRTWEYHSFADDTSLSTTLEHLGVDGVTLRGDGWREELTCDADGLWIERRVEEHDGVEAVWSFDPPGLVMPAALEPGTAWTAAWAWQYADTTGVVRVESSDTQLEVIGAGHSNVAAGAFDTLEVHVQSGSSSDTRYYAADVGLVLDDGMQLVALAD